MHDTFLKTGLVGAIPSCDTDCKVLLKYTRAYISHTRQVSSQLTTIATDFYTTCDDGSLQFTIVALLPNAKTVLKIFTTENIIHDNYHRN